MNQITFGNVTGDGTGQTIAIIVAYDYPSALNDVQAFSSQFGLPLFNQPGGPVFKRVAQDGSQNFPGTDPSGAGNPDGTWEREAALDIQWAHAFAPGANITLVEAVNGFSFLSYPLLEQAVNWARQQPGVSVINMSFTDDEHSSDASYNKYFVTPTGHQGITFVASTGDYGAPAGFPAYSPNVVAVGGTSLVLNSGQYLSESAWSGSGGGISTFQSKPWYQAAITQSAAQRTAPDISFDGDPNTGVAIYDSWDYPTSPWLKIGGTSLSAPLFAGMVAVANQGRALFGLSSLDGFSQTLPKLYNAPASDFHDITTGSNGLYSATPGYDLVTGRGTPIANLLIPDLVGVVGSISGKSFQDNNVNSLYDAGDAPISGVRLYVDANNNNTYDVGGSQNQSTGTINLAIPDNNTTGVFSQLSISGLVGNISDVNLTLSISHPQDNDLTAYLVGPDGTRITLFSNLSSFSPNFTNTSFDDQATASISTATAPFTGSFSPAWLLAAFNGKSPNGTWKLLVTDTSAGSTGTLTNFSLSVTTASEFSTLSASDGSYSLGPLAAGTQTIREILPSGFTATSPLFQTLNLSTNASSVNFAQALTTFNATASGDSFYMWFDQGTTAIGKSASPINPLYRVPAGATLTFNLSSSDSLLTVDFVNGSPLPSGNVIVNGSGLSNTEIRLLGAGSTLTLGNSQVTPTTGGILSFANVYTLSVWNTKLYYKGNLSTLQILNVNAGSDLFWG